MSYTTKHKPYKLKSIKCSGCGWSISHCMDLKKEQLRIKSLKKEVVKEYIHVDNPKCKHCIELEKRRNKKMKNKCIKCQQIRKASGVSYLKCCKCKQKASDERKKNKKNKSEMAKTNDELRKISKRLNQDSINKFIKERNGIKA
jgi:hypothetical protein